MPPNGLGRGAGEATGALGEREGVAGDVGLTGAGRAGCE